MAVNYNTIKLQTLLHRTRFESPRKTIPIRILEKKKIHKQDSNSMSTLKLLIYISRDLNEVTVLASSTDN